MRSMLGWCLVLVMTSLGVVGCTQPTALDAGRDGSPGLDAPTLDADEDASDMDAPAPDMDAPTVDVPEGDVAAVSDVPGDTPPADAGRDAPSCVDVFGDAPAFELCAERPTSCEFRVQLAGQSCNMVCASYGTSCLTARNDASFAPFCATTGGTWTCGQTGMSAICECGSATGVDAGPSTVCDSLFSAFPGHTVCSETATSCEVEVTFDATHTDCRSVCTSVGGTCDSARRTSGTACAASGMQACGAGSPGGSAICLCRL